jgi:prepilin-type N-terminal cleavage/methylation domain-containing protein
MKTNERGLTLLETMVAIVILAIVIMQMAMVPLLSKSGLSKSKTTTQATAAANDKMELFYNVLSRTKTGTNRFPGYDSLLAPPNNGGNDYYLASTGDTIYRSWTIQRRPGGVDSGIVRVQVWCRFRTGLKLDSMFFTTDLAQRDSLPGFKD